MSNRGPPLLPPGSGTEGNLHPTEGPRTVGDPERPVGASAQVSADEVHRVRDFLRRVNDASSERDQKLQELRALVASLEVEREALAERLKNSNEELERSRARADKDIEAQAQQIRDLTGGILKEQLSTQLEDAHEQVKAQYLERVRQLEKALTEKELCAEQAWTTIVESQNETREIKKAAEKETQELRQQHETERERMRTQLEEERAELKAEYERKAQHREAALAEKEEAIRKNAQEMQARADGTVSRATEATNKELAELRAKLAADRELYRKQYEEGLAQVAKQYEDRSLQLEAALEERERLLERAGATNAVLQQEADVARGGAAKALQQLRDAHTTEMEQYKNRATSLREERDQLATQFEELEAIVAEKDDLQHMQALEEECSALKKEAKQLGTRVSKLVSSLSAVQQICEASPAARSILSGAGRNVNLEDLFSALE